MSNLIKPGNYVALVDRKKLETDKRFSAPHPDRALTGEEGGGRPGQPQGLPENRGHMEDEWREEAEKRKARILQDAERQAASLVEQARREAEQVRADAEKEIQAWWEKKREEDEQHVRTVQEEGRKAGYEEGRAEAEKRVRAEYEGMMDEARCLVENAYRQKEKIIREAEPFLLELSVEIAQKVIGRQLTLSPEWMKDYIKNILQRRKDHGVISLCVNPEHYSYVLDAKEELMLVLDSQADLQIVPDRRVRDNGCIIRSSYGSIDARVDTQLSEIKQALMQLSDEEGGEGWEDANENAAG